MTKFLLAALFLTAICTLDGSTASKASPTPRPLSPSSSNATTSARLPKILMLNHSVCSCGSPALLFHRSVLAMVKVAIAVPPRGVLHFRVFAQISDQQSLQHRRCLL